MSETGHEYQGSANAEVHDLLFTDNDIFSEKSDPMVVTHPSLRYARVKDVGTRLLSDEIRHKKIVEIAQPLPEGNALTARGIYWFVTDESVAIYGDETLFEWKQTVLLGTYYLNQVDFKKNRSGTISFQFPNGHGLHVICTSTSYKPRPNKRKKTSSEEPSSSSEFPHHETPVINNNNNTNAMPTEPQQRQAPLHIQTPVIAVNVLLLVPVNFSQSIQLALRSLGYTKEANSDRLYLFNREQLINEATRHVLVYHYESFHADVMKDCFSIANDVVLFLNNSQHQPSHVMTVTRFTNFSRIQNNEIVTGTWQCVVKIPDFGALELNYAQLDQPTQRLFKIDELEALLSGVSCQQHLPSQDVTTYFREYIDRWSLKEPAVKESRQIIYLCFRYEHRPVEAFSDLAESALRALVYQRNNNVPDPVIANGSVLVYMRCPAYALWYILVRKDDIFKSLAKEGLIEIYECFISDVAASLDRPDNTDFIDELTYLKEQMINDGISEHSTTRFRVSSPPTQPKIVKLALVIGINNYKYIKSLSGAVNDVKLVKKTLIEQFDFDEENIECLLGMDGIDESRLPTRNNILAAFTRLIDRVKQHPGTIVAVHYSGHGSVKPNYNKPTRQSETIVPYDSGRLKKDGGIVDDDKEVPPSNDITDDELRTVFLELSKSAAHVAVVFDSCHSESIARETMNNARTVGGDSRLGNNKPVFDLYSRDDLSHGYCPSLDNVVVIAACAYDKIAYEVEHNSESYGALTYHWCTALQAISKDEPVTYGDVFDRIEPHFNKDKQTPKIEGERTWQLFGTSKLDTSKYATVVGQKGGDIQLNVGAVHGVTPKSVFALYKPNVRVPDGSSEITATVFLVGSTTSWTKLNQSLNLDLANYRAFEISSGTDDKIAIHLPENLPELVKKRLRRKFLLVGLESAGLVMHEVQPGDNQQFNVNLTLTKPALVVTDKDNNIVVPMDTTLKKEVVVNNLLAYALYQKHLHLTSAAPWQDQIEFVVYRSPSQLTPLQEWTEIRNEGELIEGDWVRFGVKQTTSLQKLYFAVMQFDENGAIQQLYPEDHADASPLSADLLLAIPDGNKGYGPLSIDKSIPRKPDAVIKAAFKLYVTTTPTNYRYIEQEGYSSTRGVPLESKNLVDPVEWTSKTIWCTLKHK